MINYVIVLAALAVAYVVSMFLSVMLFGVMDGLEVWFVAWFMLLGAATGELIFGKGRR